MVIIDAGQFQEKLFSFEGRLFEEEQPEKKRCRFEEEPKPQKVEEPEPQKLEDGDKDEDEYLDFIEDDSDEEEDEDDEEENIIIEQAWRIDETTNYQKETGLRNCHNGYICQIDQHGIRFFGSPVFEIFKVKLTLNKNSERLRGLLYGAIEIAKSPDNPEPISYYRVRKDKAVPITLTRGENIILPLSGPEPRPPIPYDSYFRVLFIFNFNDEDLFPISYIREREHEGDNAIPRCGVICFYPSHIHPRMKFLPGIERKLFDSDTINMAVYYSTYIGTWATVDVKINIAKKGVSSFYGSIFARPCVFCSRIRLLSIQFHQKRELQASESVHHVKLTRKVVTVPSYSSLIIAAVLHDQDGNQIVRGKTFFPALAEGHDCKVIDNDGVGLQVTINWDCKPIYADS